jgi:hypothetical protein
MSRFVPITGTRRRLEALAAIGHPATVIGAHMGRPRGSSRALIHAWRHHQARIDARTAAVIARVYEELRDVPGTNPVVRIHALRAGCLPPSAWVGVDIDDPDAVPSSEDEEWRRAA